jgi:hypothetical protein
VRGSGRRLDRISTEDGGSDSVGGQLVPWWAKGGVVALRRGENQRKEEISEGFQKRGGGCGGFCAEVERKMEGGVLNGVPRGEGECGGWP